MRVKGTIVQQYLLGLALLAALAWNLAHAGELRELQLNSGATGTRAELRLDRETGFNVISLANPDRLVVDLPDVSLGHGLKLPAATGLIKSVRSGQPLPGTTRIVFDLTAPVVALKPHFESGTDGARLVLEWPDDGGNAGVATSKPVPVPSPASGVSDTVSTTPDPALTSAAATSRLIASLPAGSAQTTSSPASDPVLPAAMPAANHVATRIATGVPTRVATGIASASTQTPSPPPSQERARAPVKTMQDVMHRGGLRPLVIAIDAGHGGQDPGARGPGGSREKMITLSIARELARQVNATPGLKAYLTRDTDVFIPLTQRYQKARAAKADLFVSIHADSFSSPDACGSSVFVLSQRGASSQAARWLASQENAADLVGGVKLQDKDDTLASVLLDLSQSATMKASEDMANQVLAGLKRLGKTHKGGVERANFVVLRSPDVPSMLVETAFISNPDEERRLNDPDQQRALARAVLDGVNAYFTRQPPPGTLYAARADAGGALGGGSP
ncbi:MAG TPA: N-acetylmuramoyl-L-alanine amidase [Luteimonas sp.]|nr:N-acetylmuramoyl-L-alanine amidase [Luteimonas sp.]